MPTITWSEGEIVTALVAKGVNSIQAALIEEYVEYISETFNPSLDRNAGLVFALEGVVRPITDVARECWGVLGTAGTTPATAASVITWITANRPDLIGMSALIGYVIYTYLGDGASAMIKSSAEDQDPLSSTYDTRVVLSKNQYATAVYNCLSGIAKLMRYVAVKPVNYPSDSANSGPFTPPLIEDNTAPQD